MTIFSKIWGVHVPLVTPGYAYAKLYNHFD